MTEEQFLAVLRSAADAIEEKYFDLPSALQTWAAKTQDALEIVINDEYWNEEKIGELVFIVAWTGGYEAPSYVVFATEEEAIKQAKEWWADADEDADSIDILRLNPTDLTIERIMVNHEKEKD